MSPSMDSESDSDVENLRLGVRHVKHLVQTLPAHELSDPNSWPCYLLEDAYLYNKQGTLVNLLNVDKDGPYVLIGRFSFEEGDSLLERLINPKFAGDYVRIENITQFSFGCRSEGVDSGHVCLWAGDIKFGWFEIAPADAYKALYANTTQAINVHYFAEALYKRKGAKDLAIGDVLLKYAAREGSGGTRSVVEAYLKSQAEFLLQRMSLKEGIDLTRTVLYSWLYTSSPDIVADLAKRNVKIIKSAYVPGTTSVRIAAPPAIFNDQDDEEPYEPQEGEDTSQAGRRRGAHGSGREKYPHGKQPRSGPHLDDEDEPMENAEDYEDDVPMANPALAKLVVPVEGDIPGLIVYVMEYHRLGGCHRRGHHCHDTKKVPLNRVGQWLYADYSVPDYHSGVYLAITHAPAILPLLPKVWHGSELHGHLMAPHTVVLNHNEAERRQHEAKARMITKLTSRVPLAVPRVHNTVRTKRTTKGSFPSSQSSRTHHLPSRPNAGHRKRSASRAESPQATTMSSSRDNNGKRRRSTPPEQLVGKARIAARAANERAKVTSAQGIRPRGKRPTLTTLDFSSSAGVTKRKQNAGSDESSSSPPSSPGPYDPPHVEPDMLTMVAQPQSFTPPAAAAAVAVADAEGRALGRSVSHLTALITQMGKDQQAARAEIIAGRPVPPPIRRAFLD